MKNKKLEKNLKWLFVAIPIFILVVIIAVNIIPKKNILISAEASLKEVAEISEVSTLKYVYNSIVTISDGEKDKYHVAYEGIVSVGFDFNDIKIEENKEERKIVFIIPPIKILDVSVNTESMETIFVKDKYETEDVIAEIHKETKEDLRNKANNNESLKNMAKKNAISSISAILKPWEEQLPDGYSVEYR